jgi:hypothetical protein
MSNAAYQIENATTTGNGIQNANPNAGIDGMNGTDRLEAAIKATETANAEKTNNASAITG